MFKISLVNQEKPTPREILFLGAHSDDLEIGCGGTILRFIEEYPQLYINWIVFGASGIRADEAQKSADVFLKGVKEKQVEILDFRDGYFPYVGAEIKDFFEGLKRRVSPDLIFTHYRHDLHQDHRLICELTWNTFRDHFILEYEIPKFDGDLSSPNFFVPLQQTICKQKVDYLLSTFKSQADKLWFTEDTFLSILRLRGIESQATEKYAEGFYCRKLVI